MPMMPPDRRPSRSSLKSIRGSPMLNLNFQSFPRWLSMLAVVSVSVLSAACAGTPSSFCPPDQLQTQPEALLKPCQPPRCLLPDDFATLDLQAQAALVGTCHE